MPKAPTKSAAPAPALTLSLQQARAAVLAAQHLEGPGTNPAQVVRDAGFVRTLGGIDVYLALAARLPGLRRAQLDAAVEARELVVTPAVRGCIYLVARRDAPLVLRLSDLQRRKRDLRDEEKAGIREGEVDGVAAAALEILRRQGPLSTTALRAACPPGLLRSLGEAGKKVGLSSALPPALRRLESAGDVERVLEEGRLDSEKYLWRATATNFFEGQNVSEDPAELHRAVAEIFYRAAALATVPQLADWMAISLKDATAATAALEPLPVAVEGRPEAYWALPERRDLLAEPPMPAKGIALLPFEDNALALHADPSFLCDPQHLDIQVEMWGMGRKMMALRDAKHPMLRSIVADGRLAGFWEYDPQAKALATAVFADLSADTRRRLAAKVEETTALITTDIGHGRSFSIDSDTDLARRAAFIRGLGFPAA